MRLTENPGDRTINPATVSKKMLMICDSFTYTTFGDVCVSHTISEVKTNTAWKDILLYLDFQRRGLFSGAYKYPGRNHRWVRGFVNSLLELTTSHPVGAKREYPGIVPLVWECLFPKQHYITDFIQPSTQAAPAIYHARTSPDIIGFKIVDQHKQLSINKRHATTSARVIDLK